MAEDEVEVGVVVAEERALDELAVAVFRERRRRLSVQLDRAPARVRLRLDELQTSTDLHERLLDRRAPAPVLERERAPGQGERLSAPRARQREEAPQRVQTVILDRREELR